MSRSPNWNPLREPQGKTPQSRDHSPGRGLPTLSRGDPPYFCWCIQHGLDFVDGCLVFKYLLPCEIRALARQEDVRKRKCISQYDDLILCQMQGPHEVIIRMC